MNAKVEDKIKSMNAKDTEDTKEKL